MVNHAIDMWAKIACHFTNSRYGIRYMAPRGSVVVTVVIFLLNYD